MGIETMDKKQEWTTPDAIDGRMGRTIKNIDFHFKPKNMNLIYINGKRFEVEEKPFLKSEFCSLIKAPSDNCTISYQDGEDIKEFPITPKNMDHFQIIRNQVGNG